MSEAPKDGFTSNLIKSNARQLDQQAKGIPIEIPSNPRPSPPQNFHYKKRKDRYKQPLRLFTHDHAAATPPPDLSPRLSSSFGRQIDVQSKDQRRRQRSGIVKTIENSVHPSGGRYLTSSPQKPRSRGPDSSQPPDEISTYTASSSYTVTPLSAMCTRPPPNTAINQEHQQRQLLASNTGLGSNMANTGDSSAASAPPQSPPAGPSWERESAETPTDNQGNDNNLKRGPIRTVADTSRSPSKPNSRPTNPHSPTPAGTAIAAASATGLGHHHPSPIKGISFSDTAPLTEAGAPTISPTTVKDKQRVGTSQAGEEVTVDLTESGDEEHRVQPPHSPFSSRQAHDRCPTDMGGNQGGNIISRLRGKDGTLPRHGKKRGLQARPLSSGDSTATVRDVVQECSLNSMSADSGLLSTLGKQSLPAANTVGAAQAGRVKHIPRLTIELAGFSVGVYTHRWLIDSPPMYKKYLIIDPIRQQLIIRESVNASVPIPFKDVKTVMARRHSDNCILVLKTRPIRGSVMLQSYDPNTNEFPKGWICAMWRNSHKANFVNVVDRLAKCDPKFEAIQTLSDQDYISVFRMLGPPTDIEILSIDDIEGQVIGSIGPAVSDQAAKPTQPATATAASATTAESPTGAQQLVRTNVAENDTTNRDSAEYWILSPSPPLGTVAEGLERLSSLSNSLSLKTVPENERDVKERRSSRISKAKTSEFNDHTSMFTYPFQGTNSVTVTWADRCRLNDFEFLNDTIIEFYLRYIRECIFGGDPQIAEQVFVFSPFFFNQLARRNTAAASDNGYQRIRKWTNKVDLFSKRYLIVPINESYHWYMAVIYNPGLAVGGNRSRETSQQQDQGQRSDAPDTNLTAPAVVPESNEVIESGMVALSVKRDSRGENNRLKRRRSRIVKSDNENEEEEEDISLVYASAPKQPVPPRRSSRVDGGRLQFVDAEKSASIFIFDSLGTHHPRTFNILNNYLAAEAKARLNIQVKEKLRGYYAKVPMQPNTCDCGLYLLQYVEEFLRHPKDCAHKIVNRMSLEKGWFEITKVANKRREIMRVIDELHEQYQIHTSLEENKKAVSDALLDCKDGNDDDSDVMRELKEPDCPGSKQAQASRQLQTEGGVCEEVKEEATRTRAA